MRKYSELKVSDFDDIEKTNFISKLRDKIVEEEDIVVNLFKERICENVKEAINTLDHDECYIC